MLRINRHPFKYITAIGLVSLVGAAGCNPPKPTTVAPTLPGASAVSAIKFEDATSKSGIKFKHNNGAFGALLMPEIMGSGVAFVDYDGDGYPDVFVVNGRNWTKSEIEAFKNGTGKGKPELFASAPGAEKTTCVLYHNNHDGTFTDVTKGSGLDVEMYGMGVTIGDYDNDGKTDIFVTALGRNYLFHNEGAGKFKDVSESAGVKGSGWSTSAAWVDYDKDGKLDLFVCHYVTWKPETDIFCTTAGKAKDYCTPESYQGEFCRLYHNEGGGKFKDVTEASGLMKQKAPDGSMRSCQGKSLGVAIGDFNDDGWPDIVVGNDTEPNYLFQNNKNGTFTEIGRESGIALNEAGQARASMGTDVADIDRSGRQSIIFGNFSNQMLGLYQNQGSGLFIDVAPQSGVGPPSLKFLAFGTLFVDVDNDTWPDIFVANGHVVRDIESTQRDVSFKERPLLYRNKGKGLFDEVGVQSGAPFGNKTVGRGSASADFDLDGNIDVIMSSNGGGVTLFRNLGASGNGSFRLTLEGTKSNRSAIGAVVEVASGSDTQRLMVKSGSSYCSASELSLTVGLGKAVKADSVTIKWPSGEQTKLKDMAAGHSFMVTEGKGITSDAQLKKP